MKFIAEIYSDKALPTWREFNKSILFKAKKNEVTTTTTPNYVVQRIMYKNNNKKKS